jgi:hypothetical protein
VDIAQSCQGRPDITSGTRFITLLLGFILLQLVFIKYN